MHKIAAKEFTLEDFSHEHLTSFIRGQNLNGWTLEENDLIALPNDPDYGYSSVGILRDIIIKALNFNRIKYLETKDKKYWWQLIQLLPSSYNQKRTVMLNYGFWLIFISLVRIISSTNGIHSVTGLRSFLILS